MKQAKPKKCRQCRAWFQPRSSFARACSPECAVADAKEQREKRERKERRARKQALKSKSQHAKEAQSAFNAYIRERDRGKPCISCGATEQQTDYLKISGWVASHYRSVGACPELRFDELNVHLACVRCNSHLSGNIVEYRLGLIERCGQNVVDYLEGHHEPKHYTIEDLQEIKATYRRKARELRRQHEHTGGQTQTA